MSVTHIWNHISYSFTQKNQIVIFFGGGQFGLYLVVHRDYF